MIESWYGLVRSWSIFQACLNILFLLKHLVCLFNLRIPKTVRFWNLKHHLKHRTFCLTMQCFERCDFLMMFQKIAKHCANDASLTMHRTPLEGRHKFFMLPKICRNISSQSNSQLLIVSWRIWVAIKRPGLISTLVRENLINTKQLH